WRMLRGLAPPIALAVAGGAGLVACGTSKYHYVTTKSPTLVYKIPVGKRTLRRAVEAADSYYKVPRSWKVFSKEQVLSAMPGVDAQPGAQTDQQSGHPKVEIIARDDEVVRPGGFHGTQVLFNLKGDHGLAYTVNQTTLTDTASRLLYTLVIGCEARCYVQNAK